MEFLNTENQQFQHLERVLFGVGAIIDANLLANFIGQYFGWLSRKIRRITTITAIGFGIYSIFQALLNFQSRKAILQSLESEIQHQIEAKKQS
jgi:MFS family permease